MLGFLHKRVLGNCHPLLVETFPFASGLDANYNSRALHPFTEEVNYQRRLFDRSIFSYILMYNRLPQDIVDLPSVSIFQAKLTHIARQRAQRDPEHWRQSFQNMADVAEMFG